jgi:hypothetical protein
MRARLMCKLSVASDELDLKFRREHGNLRQFLSHLVANVRRRSRTFLPVTRKYRPWHRSKVLAAL